MKKMEPLNLQNWRNTPSTNNRVATIEDVEKGRAVFVIENVSPSSLKPYKIELPKLAYWNDVELGQRKLIGCNNSGRGNTRWNNHWL